VLKESDERVKQREQTQPHLDLLKEKRGERIPNVGLAELMESERRNKKRKEMSTEEPKSKEKITPRFEMGQRVYYFIDDEAGNEKWHSARIMYTEYPGEGENPANSNQIIYRISPDYERGKTYVPITRKEKELRDWNWVKPYLVANKDGKSQPLLPLDRVGIDTCSALSVSSSRKDFLWLDESSEAKRSVILRGVGVGGETARIGGRGPMVVQASDCQGNKVVMYDPSAVFLYEAVDQAGFRIFGQQRLKKFGFNLQQNDQNNDTKIIPLETNRGILTLRTSNLSLTEGQKENLEHEISEALKGGDNKNYCLQVQTHTSLLMNEANLTKEEAERLHHWRIGHRSIGKSSLNENCPMCIEGKKKVGSFKRNYEFHGHTKGRIRPYFRLYCDGYGGQQSMGEMSYQMGIGGFVFACPSGSIKTKLYGLTEQFPSILFQVLQEVESEGCVTREVYVDTHSVNLSRAAEEVAAMFRVRIIPVSAGTPQEMAYAESAVRTVGQMGRTLMCGAPHLPKFCWCLADLHANLIRDVLPQKKIIEGSPYEYRTGRRPDLDLLFVKVFGAPCQYSPMGGPDHKRAPKTEWGWFVGVQSPMCLVHGECYAKFSFEFGMNPLAHFTVSMIDLQNVKNYAENLTKIKDYKKICQIPDHVLSIKCLSDFQNTQSLMRLHQPPTHPKKCLKKQPFISRTVRGRIATKPYVPVPDHVGFDRDLMLDKIRSMREMINKRFDLTFVSDLTWNLYLVFRGPRYA
jgi:hypothetical protein